MDGRKALADVRRAVASLNESFKLLIKVSKTLNDRVDNAVEGFKDHEARIKALEDIIKEGNK